MVRKNFFLAAIAIITLLQLVPFPHPVETDPEPWMYPFNQAVANQMAIGKEIVFTFGPYAGIYTQSFQPQLNSLLMLTGLGLAITAAVSLISLAKDAQLNIKLLVLFSLIGGVFSREGLLGSLPLLFGLAAKPGPLLGLTMMSLGLLPLIKGSYLASAVMVAGLILIRLIVRREYRAALWAAAILVASQISWWWLAGQSLVNLPNYYLSMGPIIRGFTPAMALYSRNWEVLLYLLVAGRLLWQLRANWYLWLLVGIHLGIQFKGGFVRHDGHVLNATTGLILGVTWLATIIRQRQFGQIVAGTILAALLISEKQVPSLVTTIPKNIIAPGVEAVNSWRISEKKTIAPPKISLPVLPGTSDIYSVDQALLLLSGNQWNPRPVFQSYSAYTPELLRLNRDHLLTQPPDNIFFKVEPIDDRLPALEDGASWPILLSSYAPTSTTATHLVLKHQTNNVPQLKHVATIKAKLGETVSLLQSGGHVWARMQIEPSLTGKLIGFVYKPQELRIVLTLADGRQANYRIIPSMTQTEFMLSPLVENTADFANLYAGLNQQQVKSFRIITTAATNYSWQSAYQVELFEF